MLASGYLKVDGSHIRETDTDWDQIYELSVTNFEVMIMLKKLVRGWFAPSLPAITSLSGRCCRMIYRR